VGVRTRLSPSFFVSLLKRKGTVLVLLLCAVFFLFTAKSWSQARLEPDFQIARVKYGGGGDWYSDPTSLPNLLSACRERLEIRAAAEPRVLSLNDLDLFDYPMLYLTGHGNVKLTDAEVKRLRRYLESGGFLWCDDNGPGRDSLDVSFRREMQKVFPEQDFVRLPFNHPIYHVLYEFPSGPPKIHNHYPDQPPKGFGLFHEGRLVVFYTWNSDIGDGLEDPQVHDNPPSKREKALQMALNVVSYVLSY
jgi:hypothetical protein